MKLYAAATVALLLAIIQTTPAAAEEQEVSCGFCYDFPQMFWNNCLTLSECDFIRLMDGGIT